MNEGCVTKADVDTGRTRGFLKRCVEHLDAVTFSFLRPGLHVGFIKLNHVGTCLEQVRYFRLYRQRVGCCGFTDVGVVIILRLLCHSEGTGDSKLNGTISELS